MSIHAVRTTLAALVVAALAALTPAAALARATPSRVHADATPLVTSSITSALAVSEPGGSRAGSTTTLGLVAHFTAIGGDALSAMEIVLPSGTLLNTEIDKGACLTATAPAPACLLASGTATLAGVVQPAALYLVHPPGADDLAGVQLVAGSASIAGSLSLQSPLDTGTTATIATHLTFKGLAGSAISALSVNFAKVVRLPSSCSPVASVSLWSTGSLLGFPSLARAPMPVTDCGKLAYTPGIASTVAVNPHTRLARLTTTITQPAGQSATARMKVSLAPGLVPRRQLAKCVEGTPCVIGSASLTSPLLPATALSAGTMTLGGTHSSPTVAITFPEPDPLVLSGSLSSSSGQLTLSDLPDIPITTMALHFAGTSTSGPVLLADLANCQENQYHATLFPTSGVQAAGLTGIVLYHGCPHFGHHRAAKHHKRK